MKASGSSKWFTKVLNISFVTMLLIVSPTLYAQMEEIIVTAPRPAEANHTWDSYWFWQGKLHERHHGVWDDDIEMLDYYEELYWNSIECEAEADLEVTQCKTVYSNEGGVLCGAGAGIVLGFFGRFLPQGAAADALAPGTIIATLSCTNLIATAHQWCETTFKERIVQNCMDADDS